MNTPTLKRICGLVLCLFMALALVHAEDGWSKKKHRKAGRKPRYSRPANVGQCSSYSWKPSAKSLPRGAGVGNNRVPYHQMRINRYLTALNAKGCGLNIQSTFRDCRTNSSVGGAQKSRHLCGGGADTSGCSKPIAKSVCRQQGLTYIEEGSGKFPHCQVDSFCNQIRRD